MIDKWVLRRSPWRDTGCEAALAHLVFLFNKSDKLARGPARAHRVSETGLRPEPRYVAVGLRLRPRVLLGADRRQRQRGGRPVSGVPRRAGRLRSSYGSGTGDPQNDVWGYNDRNELTATDRFTGTGANSPGGGTADDTLDRDYAYDPIGNRTAYGEGTAATKFIARTSSISTRRSTTTAATARRRAERTSP